MSLFKGIRYYLLPEDNKSRTLKTILGFYPKNMSLYNQAFRHKSILASLDEKHESNERLEYLGDAILGAVIAEYFFNKYPYKGEGFLTKMRSRLVRRSFLNQLAIDIGLDTFIETAADTGRSKSIFGDAFEALIGAIYIDKGYAQCKKFITQKIIKDYVDIDQLVREEKDFKSKLVEYCQKKKRTFEYQLTEKENKQIKYYFCTLLIDNQPVCHAEGSSKKEAEQAAAKLFFKNSVDLTKR